MGRALSVPSLSSALPLSSSLLVVLLGGGRRTCRRLVRCRTELLRAQEGPGAQ